MIRNSIWQQCSDYCKSAKLLKWSEQPPQLSTNKRCRLLFIVIPFQIHWRSQISQNIKILLNSFLAKCIFIKTKQNKTLTWWNLCMCKASSRAVAAQLLSPLQSLLLAHVFLEKLNKTNVMHFLPWAACLWGRQHTRLPSHTPGEEHWSSCVRCLPANRKLLKVQRPS